LILKEGQATTAVERQGQSGEKMTEVVAVVVTFQSAGVLPACLRALKSQVDRIVVVDNASADATRDIARAHGAEVIENRANEGYGFANNRGIEAATGDWCLIVNPDVTVEEGCVVRLVDASRRSPNAAILVPRLVEPDGRPFFRSESVLSDVPPTMALQKDCPNEDGSVAFASGACMLVNRERFLKLGGFDESIFLYYEDDDLSVRTRQAGLQILYVNGAIAHHVRGNSSEIVPGKIYKSRFHLAWSRAYVGRKYRLREGNVNVIARNGLKLLWALVSGNKMRIERYSGSIAGAWAAIRKRPAIVRETVK
jgi:GT2 family glycosyltransferase